MSSSDSDVMRAVLAGAKPDDAHFEAYYRLFHAEHQAATETSLREFVDDRGQNTYQRLAGEVSLMPDARVLDIGCADGALLERVIARFPSVRVAGVDLAEVEISRAKERLPAVNVERLVAANADALPFADGTFEAVFSHMMLMIVPDASLVVHEVRRVLKAGCTFASLVPRIVDFADAIDEMLRLIPQWVRERHPGYAPVNPGDSRVLDDDAVVGLFTSNGFADITFDDFVVSRSASPKVLRDLVQNRYYVGSLPPQTRAHIDFRVQQWADNKTFTYRQAMRIILAR